MTDLPVYLRPTKKVDAKLLLSWENDPDNRVYTPEKAIYNEAEILAFIEDANNVRENKQLRLMICLRREDTPIGAIDLFDIDFNHQRAGVGILIADEKHRRKNYASLAISLMEAFALKKLDLIQLHCLIQLDNHPSIKLFEKSAFIRTGQLKNWFKQENKWYDAYFYQKMID